MSARAPAFALAPHQRVVRELTVALTAWLRERRVGDVFDSLDAEPEPHSLVRPDVLVVPPDEAVRLETEMPARSLILVAGGARAGTAGAVSAQGMMMLVCTRIDPC